MKIIKSLAFTLLFCAVAMAENPRVFITDSQSWEVRSAAAGSNGSFGGSSAGGARPQTAEIIKTFGERCPQVTVNNKQEKADYIVLLDHEGGKGWLAHKNKVAVFNHGGDTIVSHSTLSLGGSVQDACAAIVADWDKNGGKRPEEVKAADTPSSKTPEFVGTKVSLTSTPNGADVEINGSFVGNTPSAIVLPQGEHTISIKKAGFKDWERKIKVSGGEVNLTAELEKKP